VHFFSFFFFLCFDYPPPETSGRPEDIRTDRKRLRLQHWVRCYPRPPLGEGDGCPFLGYPSPHGRPNSQNWDPEIGGYPASGQEACLGALSVAISNWVPAGASCYAALLRAVICIGGWLGKGAGKRAWEASGAIFKQPPDRNNAQAGRPMSGTETTAHESWFHN